MKSRESGMPEQEMWDQFFDPDIILDDFGIRGLIGNIVDLGCGYGTFAIPAARKNKGTIYALDIEAEMIQTFKGRPAKPGWGTCSPSSAILWQKEPGCLTIVVCTSCSLISFMPTNQ